MWLKIPYLFQQYGTWTQELAVQQWCYKNQTAFWVKAFLGIGSTPTDTRSTDWCQIWRKYCWGLFPMVTVYISYYCNIAITQFNQFPWGVYHCFHIASSEVHDPVLHGPRIKIQSKCSNDWCLVISFEKLGCHLPAPKTPCEKFHGHDRKLLGAMMRIDHRLFI